eukprot:1154824_1
MHSPYHALYFAISFFFQFVITYKNGSYFHCCRHITHVILHNISKTLASSACKSSAKTTTTFTEFRSHHHALKALNHETSIHHKQKTLTFNSTISAKLTASQFH